MYRTDVEQKDVKNPVKGVVKGRSKGGIEPPRVSRRPFCLSHATWADSVSC
ncbi:YD repeat-containing protein [Pseudomonas amygdali pv. morsprunorum]|nr:YD repeat-containing protein [Pseudomonas amygdali pv. morsprunorum]